MSRIAIKDLLVALISFCSSLIITLTLTPPPNNALLANLEINITLCLAWPATTNKNVVLAPLQEVVWILGLSIITGMDHSGMDYWNGLFCTKNHFHGL